MSVQTLYPQQIDALNAIAGELQAGKRRLLVKMPTGVGKTTVFSSLRMWLASWLSQFSENDRRMLVVAHREELLDQACARIQQNNPGAMVSIEQGSRVANRHSDVVVASIQTLSALKFRRLKYLITQRPFRIVVYDEAHHAAAASYRTALVHLGFLPAADASDTENIEAANPSDLAEMTAALDEWDRVAPTDRVLVGFTATPNRTDAIGLACVFQTIAYSYDLKDAIEAGLLVPFVPWVVETDTSLDAVRIARGEFHIKDLAAAVNTTARNQVAVEAWHRYAKDRSTIAFTVDVRHAHDLAEAFSASGVQARPLSGETPKDERRGMLRDYGAGRVSVLSNCMVLTEGTDLPRTSCILHAKPTKSATLYEQMTGRGLRLFPEKTDCIVIDVVDIARKHSLQTAPMLAGLPPGLMVNGDLDKAGLELAELRAQNRHVDLDLLLRTYGRQTLEQLRLKVKTFDVWKVPVVTAEFARGRMFEWAKVGDDQYRMAYKWQGGYERLDVQPDLLGHFEVVITTRSETGGTSQRTLARNCPSPSAAAGLSEAWIQQERRETIGLLSRHASWRQKGATEPQLGRLRQLGVPVRPGLTAGEASNLINYALARRGH